MQAKSRHATSRPDEPGGNSEAGQRLKQGKGGPNPFSCKADLRLSTFLCLMISTILTASNTAQVKGVFEIVGSGSPSLQDKNLTTLDNEAPAPYRELPHGRLLCDNDKVYSSTARSCLPRLLHPDRHTTIFRLDASLCRPATDIIRQSPRTPILARPLLFPNSPTYILLCQLITLVDVLHTCKMLQLWPR